MTINTEQAKSLKTSTKIGVDSLSNKRRQIQPRHEENECEAAEKCRRTRNGRRRKDSESARGAGSKSTTDSERHVGLGIAAKGHDYRFLSRSDHASSLLR